MTEPDTSKRSILFREAVAFQLKLMADGLRDLALIPISLAAAVLGLARGGDEPEREFQQVLDLGRKSEAWINLFGNHSSDESSGNLANIDNLFTHVEESLKKQYKSHGTSEQAQAEIEDALSIAHEQAREKNAD